MALCIQVQHRISSVSKAVLIVSAVCQFTGCKSKEKVTAAPGTAPAYSTLAELHNSRVAQLQQVYADGVIEIQWRDDKGKHREQGNMELWLRQPSSTALRVEKLGEVLLWVGSDDQRYWAFDMLSDETVLRAGNHDEPAALGVSGVSNAFDVRPLVLLDLMGFVNMSAGAEPAVQFEPKLRAWMVELQGRASPLRMYFDTTTHLPFRIESLSPTGEPVLVSTLARNESVFQKGISPAAFPKMPHSIKIVSQETKGDRTASGEVALFINDATSDVDSAELARVFDLNRLIRGLNPSRIEGLDVNQQAAAAERP